MLLLLRFSRRHVCYKWDEEVGWKSSFCEDTGSNWGCENVGFEEEEIKSDVLFA